MPPRCSVRPVKRIILGDNAAILPTLPERFARLVYIDPPFNTGKRCKSATRMQSDRREREHATATKLDSAVAATTCSRVDMQDRTTTNSQTTFDEPRVVFDPAHRGGASAASRTTASLFVHLDRA